MTKLKDWHISVKIIKKITNFLILYKVFIWVTIKILSNYNLDLSLTKYYKNRLESQQKNRKIYTYT